jgi:uncharacterized membrane protein (UPF0127 family)
VQRADSFRSRLVGLLGRERLGDDEGLWIEPCDSVHTFFMRFPIDVAFVDGEGVVVKRVDRLRPWRATRLHSRARACVELAAGTLARAGVQEGGRLALVPTGNVPGGAADGVG